VQFLHSISNIEPEVAQTLKIPVEEKMGTQGNTYYVGIGEVHMGFSNDHLKISSLGSCIGLVIYPNDKNENKCATMGHIMLPKAPSNDSYKPKRKSKWETTRFADIAVPVMIKNLIKTVGQRSGRREAFVGKMIGGAEMFGMTKLSYKIGKENTRMTKQLLKQNDIPLIKEFTGGDTGMSVDFNVSDYTLRVKPTGGNSFKI
jgi:chemotaxis protein CheD